MMVKKKKSTKMPMPMHNREMDKMMGKKTAAKKKKRKKGK